MVLYFWSIAFVASHSIDLNCTFYFTFYKGYYCKVNELVIEHQDTEISNVNGDHLLDRDNWSLDVLYIKSSRNMFYLPANLKDVFPNLQKFIVSRGRLNFIDQSNFKGLIFLDEIGVTSSDLSIVDENTFHELILLETLILSNNQIKILGEKTFEKLANLRKLWLSGNLLVALPLNIFEKNLELEEICLNNNRLVYLNKQLFEKNVNLRKIHINNNKLKIIESGIFSVLTKLNVVELRKNICISKSVPADMTISHLSEEIEAHCNNSTLIAALNG